MKYGNIFLLFEQKTFYFDQKTMLNEGLIDFRFRMTDNRSWFNKIMPTFATDSKQQL